MADFKEHGTRCRVHPPTGEPVLCLFDEDQQDEVLESILHYVRVVGEAREDPNTGKIASIKIADIRILEEHEDAQTDLLPVGTPVPQSFWRSPSMEELAESQDVAPLTALDELIGSWPGEVRDGFEDTIINLRQRNRAGGRGMAIAAILVDTNVVSFIMKDAGRSPLPCPPKGQAGCHLIHHRWGNVLRCRESRLGERKETRFG